MAHGVVTLGNINIDIIYSSISRIPNEGEEIYSEGFDVQLGGGQPATAVNLKRLGVPVKLCTFLGDDLFSRFALSELTKNSLEPVNLYKGSKSPLTVTSIISTPRDRTFVSYKPEVNELQLDEGQVYELYKDCRIACASLEYTDVWKRLKKEGVTLVLDSGWSEEFSIDTFEETLKVVDYFTPNELEARHITGSSTPQEAIRVLAGYLKKPIVKLGDNGCMAFDNGIQFSIPAVPGFEKIDATGAGDAFLSGFIYGLYNNYSFRDCILLGNVTGGKCVTGVGCLTEYFNEQELLEYLNKHA